MRLDAKLTEFALALFVPAVAGAVMPSVAVAISEFFAGGDETWLGEGGVRSLTRVVTRRIEVE